MAISLRPEDFHPHLRLSDRCAALLAWALGVALFSTVGWVALRPHDPHGAVTLLNDPQPVALMVQMAALSIVVAGAATVLVGRKLADAGIFATCFGIAVANLRGTTLASVLLEAAEGGAAARREIASKFMLESLAWFGIVLLAMLVSAAVLRWCFREGDPDLAATSSIMSAANLPVIGRHFRSRGAALPVTPDAGLTHTLALAFGAFVLIRIFATGSPPRTIAHGQVYFSIAAAFCAAGYLLQGYLPTRTPLWSCLAVPLVALLAYGWSIVTDSNQATPFATIPPSPYFRALPIEYITLGTGGAILSFWWTRGSYAARLQPKEEKRTGR